jgi:hypothetical protein
MGFHASLQAFRVYGECTHARKQVCSVLKVEVEVDLLTEIPLYVNSLNL